MKIHISDTTQKNLSNDIKNELLILFQSAPQKENIQFFLIDIINEEKCKIVHYLPISKFIYTITFSSSTIKNGLKLALLQFEQDIWILSNTEYNASL